MMLLYKGLLSAGALCAAVQLASAGSPEKLPAPGVPHIQIPHVEIPPRLQQVLETGAQQNGLRIEGFRQRNLHDGDPATETTVVYLSYTDTSLYAVFVCSSPHGRPRAHLGPRDHLDGDETVSLLLDTLHDGRHAYEFIANPLGIQMDGMITEGQQEDFDFDTQWKSEGRLTPGGYTVYFEIPFKSLRFKAGRREPVGIALTRYMPLTNESASWPLLTSNIEAYVPQFAMAEAMPEIRVGHNLQLAPHAFTSIEQDNTPSGDTLPVQKDISIGLDAKWVTQRGLTLDLTVNPDFSQVEADDPQITTNQRYEVYFPEKRPFFTESASFFQTPEDLFFSRRIVSPRAGARLTGKKEATTMGMLAVVDHAKGLNPEEPDNMASALAAVMRVQQDLGRESTAGTFVSQYSIAGSTFRTMSFDTRLKLTPNWVATAQLARLESRHDETGKQSGHIFLAELARAGRHFTYEAAFNDVGPEVEPVLGFIPRTDLKQADQRAGYQWRPEQGAVVGFGGSIYGSVDWNHAGELQDWQVNLPASVQLKRATTLSVGREETQERYMGTLFRESANYAAFSTESLNWASLDCAFARGTNINYYPAGNNAPALARSTDANVSLTLRPSTRIRIEELYLLDQLQQLPGAPRSRGSGSSILRDQIFSSRVNVQFSRRLSIRSMADYNYTRANEAVIDLKSHGILRTAAQLTYLISPGTAVYAGYSNGLPGMRPQNDLLVREAGVDGNQTRQIYAKVSYTFRP